MQQIKIIKSLILCALSFNSIIQTETTKSNSQTKQAKEVPLTAAERKKIAQLIEFSEKSILKIFASLQKIENKLTEIALLVKKGSFANPAMNINKIMEIITANKMILNTLLESQATILAMEDPGMNLEYSHIFTEFCNTFIPYLTHQIQTGFKNAKPFDIKRFFMNMNNKNKKRSNMQHLSKPALIKGLKKTKIELRTLQQSVEGIGLTWYNKLARSLDKNIVTPANKYHVPTILSYGTGAGLLGLFVLWRYGWTAMNGPQTPKSLGDFIKKLISNNNGPLIENRLGDHYLVTEKGIKSTQPDSQTVKMTDNASIFASMNNVVKSFIKQDEPLASMAAMYMLSSVYTTWKEDIYPTLLVKRDQLWNFLRGGEYRNTVQPKMIRFQPTVSFKDMVGLDEVKQEFASIIQYIDNPEQLMRLEATPEKGWLLTGPTRTGKSFSVECLCGEIQLALQRRGLRDMKFFNIPATLINQHGITAILNEVKENAPAVVFIDEIDLLGLTRVGNNQLLSEFLISMQSSINADPSKIVIMIAATNHPEHLDKALRQNGRFGKEIRFEYPSRKYRIEFIIRELTGMAVDIRQFNPEILADKTNDVSFEALKSVIRNAMTRAWLYKKSLTQELLEESIDTEIHNIMPFDRKNLPEKESRIVATHFAGRALASMFLEMHEQLDKVTIHARKTNVKDELAWDTISKKDEQEHQIKIEYGALMTKQSHDSINMKNETVIINEAMVLIAGFAAEELLLGPCGFTCHGQDRERAFQLIKKLIFGGINPLSLPKVTREKLMLKAHDILQKCHEDAMKLLIEHKEALIALTDELLKKKIMSAKEIQAIIDNIARATTKVIEEPNIDENKEVERVSHNAVTETLEETANEAIEHIGDDAKEGLETISDEIIEQVTDYAEEALESITDAAIEHIVDGSKEALEKMSDEIEEKLEETIEKDINNTEEISEKDIKNQKQFQIRLLNK